MRYAQEKQGQRLHMVRELDVHLDGESVSRTAMCGKTAAQGWRMTVSWPLANACQNCMRAYDRGRTQIRS